MSSNQTTKIVLTGVVLLALAAMITAAVVSPDLAFARSSHSHGGNGGHGGDGGDGGDAFCPGRDNECDGGDGGGDAFCPGRDNGCDGGDFCPGHDRDCTDERGE
ncbi:hypothetical protein NTE_02616 [Candidatus Nitrososphaera evergladensis SR1]|uniref:Uncharacterized protein n=1 Tax=Candidatus Nitrososphaera evergladensis SR1 TaxID=1459636 RepID=A0A075MZI3_9ARCH|nr:hypothetical protein NTE_02616 [Candidatus Nitrososphaera evergladensis SR1]